MLATVAASKIQSLTPTQGREARSGGSDSSAAGWDGAQSRGCPADWGTATSGRVEELTYRDYGAELSTRIENKLLLSSYPLVPVRQTRSPPPRLIS